MLSKLYRLWNTLKYLRFQQLYGRIRKSIIKPKHDTRPAPPCRNIINKVEASENWITPIAGQPSLLSPNRFRFLNEEHDIFSPAESRDPRLNHLWRYHFHYFDDLNAEGAADRRDWHAQWITSWMRDYTAGTADAWDPYPTSLRIVNWIKYHLSGTRLLDAQQQSLTEQVRWLAGSLEFHLLGNHLLANAKALVFAGVYFGGNEGNSWLQRGLEILAEQLPEQILSDGGHFELSPMYHCTILEDLLDLWNLSRVAKNECPDFYTAAKSWLPKIQAMRHWLQTMLHPDGQISFFNDAALDHASSPQALEAYATRLELGSTPEILDGITMLESSGYIRYQNGNTVLIVDAAKVGPDYIPGHAHADTLTFELSINGQRAIVNSGTSVYGSSPERLRQRGTAAHNTIEIDGENSSEVWGGFRVARRAKPWNLNIDTPTPHIAIVTCAHDGYQRLAGHNVHTRTWRIEPNLLQVTDQIKGQYLAAVRRIHFAPAWQITGKEGSAALNENEAALKESTLAEGTHLQLESNGEKISIALVGTRSGLIESTFHPRFGECVKNLCLVSHFPALAENEKIARSFELRWNN